MSKIGMEGYVTALVTLDELFSWMLPSDRFGDGSRAGYCMVGVKYYISKGAVTYPLGEGVKYYTPN